ncbi:FtsX-like permease family protein [Candidatus Peregrinibacteria bacterium]|nr:MAG: FtsX-like permease family protein [Candidatus Peregrinibacteria bacterium]
MRPRSPHSLRRLAILALQNVHRNWLLSAATILMMGLILFIFNVMLLLNILAQNSLDELGKKVDLIVYLTDEASLYEVTELANALETQAEIVQVEYTSKDDALKAFLAQYPDQKDPFKEYGIENPLPGSLRIVTETPGDHADVLQFIQDSVYGEFLLDTESTNENQTIAERLLNLTAFTQKLILGVLVAFLIGTLLMSMNAVHLSIFNRKTEIQIMQLVGAKPFTIYSPFLMEGALYSVLATCFSGLLLSIFLKSTQLLPHLNFAQKSSPFTLAGLEFLCSIALGLLASSLAVRLYLHRSLVLDNA